MKPELILKGDMKNVVAKDQKVVYEGGDLNVDGAVIENCDFEVRGAAGEGVSFMKALYEAGAKKTVLRTFLTEEEYEKVATALCWHGKDGGNRLN